MRKTVIIEVSSNRGLDIQNVVFPSYVAKYRQNMVGVYRGDQLIKHGSVLYSKAHFESDTNFIT